MSKVDVVDLVVDLVDVDLDVEVSHFQIVDFSNFRKFQNRVWML